MSSSLVLEANKLSKRFKIYSSPWHRLIEWLTLGKRRYHKVFWAVKDASFVLRRGEFLAIIGPNGAGKSTLLRMITNVTAVTKGEFEASGRVLSILELSVGMDRALTGRENVIRSGRLLGFPDGYLVQRIDQIKQFSEIGEFFERPVHTYSTGMRTRLSFAMFAFLDCDILILDEVLAVGDIFFKQKCFARLNELIKKNTSIILVTHNMGIVKRYCDRTILLNKGNLIYDGDTGKAINMYLQLRGKREIPALKTAYQDDFDESKLVFENTLSDKASQSQEMTWPSESVFTFCSFPNIKGQGRARLIRLAVLNDSGEPSLVYRQGEKVNLYYEYKLLRDIHIPVARVEIRDKFNLLIHSKDSLQAQSKVPTFIKKGETIRWHQELWLNLAPNNYTFSIELLSLSHKNVFSINEWQKEKFIRLSYLRQAFAIVLTHYNQAGIELLHGGLVDLNGKCEFFQMIPKRK